MAAILRANASAVGNASVAGFSTTVPSVILAGMGNNTNLTLGMDDDFASDPGEQQPPILE